MIKKALLPFLVLGVWTLPVQPIKAQSEPLLPICKSRYWLSILTQAKTDSVIHITLTDSLRANPRRVNEAIFKHLLYNYPESDLSLIKLERKDSVSKYRRMVGFYYYSHDDDPVHRYIYLEGEKILRYWPNQGKLPSISYLIDNHEQPDRILYYSEFSFSKLDIIGLKIHYDDISLIQKITFFRGKRMRLDMKNFKRSAYEVRVEYE
ncbi:MAG: hypothetical protein AAF740_04880 [Bacteroidota bacterium]